jgi:outer membrane protein TolC
VTDRKRFSLAIGWPLEKDVLTAFSVLATARVVLAQAKSNYLLAVLNLYNVMGL